MLRPGKMGELSEPPTHEPTTAPGTLVSNRGKAGSENRLVHQRNRCRGNWEGRGRFPKACLVHHKVAGCARRPIRCVFSKHRREREGKAAQAVAGKVASCAARRGRRQGWLVGRIEKADREIA